jgi:hypothetical protein
MKVIKPPCDWSFLEYVEFINIHLSRGYDGQYR